MKPKRIQRKRTKGYRLPPNTVYVGRPTKWGNPFRVGDGIGNNAEAVMHYRSVGQGVWLEDEASAELRGKDLACWCRLDSPCHADVLLEWANAT